MRRFCATFVGVLILGATACVSTSTSSEQPLSTAPLRPAGPVPVEVYVDHALVIVVGVVEEGRPEVLAGRTFYRDWEVYVEQYLTDPLPHPRLVVRTFTGATDARGNRMPVKMPTLAQGERVILFLNKDWDDPPLGAREYVMPNPLGGKLRIVDGMVHVRYADEPDRDGT